MAAPLPVADAASLTEIELTVLDNMRLAIYPQEIARAGEHNSAVFRIVQQPAKLEGLPCRAEIRTGDGKSFYVLVTDGTFLLTNDITEHGVGTLQLVYADETVSHRTQLAQYWVAPSIYAVDPSDPDYQDGLAQLQQTAFVDAQVDASILRFFNRAGAEVDQVTLPGSVGDLDARYLQLAGGRMAGVIAFAGNQGVAFEPALSAIQEVAGQLQGRNGAGPFSPIVLQDVGDQRYLTSSAADARYLQLSGGQMSGVLSMAPLQRFISAMGNGNNPMLCIGSNDSGFWRTGQSLILEMGFAVTAIFSPTGSTFYGPVVLPAAPTQPTQATTKAYVDERQATSLKFDIPTDFPLTGSWQNLYTVAYPIPRGGLSRVRVSVSASVRAAIAGGLSIVGISCQPDIAIDRIERQAFVYNLNGTTSGFTVEFFVDVNGAAPVLTLQVMALATNPGNNDITIIGGDTFNQQRSQVLIEDMGPR